MMSTAWRKARASWSRVVMSLKRMPSLGKLGTSRIFSASARTTAASSGTPVVWGVKRGETGPDDRLFFRRHGAECYQAPCINRRAAESHARERPRLDQVYRHAHDRTAGRD